MEPPLDTADYQQPIAIPVPRSGILFCRMTFSMLLVFLLVGCAAFPQAGATHQEEALNTIATSTSQPTLIATVLPGATATIPPPAQVASANLSAAEVILPAATSLPTPLPTEVASIVLAEPTPLLPTPTPLDERQQLFEQVWNTINEQYLYPDFRGVDWAAIRNEFAPLVAEVEDDEALYAVLTDMVSRLADQHSRFVPPSVAVAEDVRSQGREAQVGIGVITVPLADGAFVQQVFPGSPAEQAGIQPRDRIVAVDGEFYAYRPIEGAAGSQVRLTIVRPDSEESRDVVLTRQLVEGRISPLVRRLNGDIGYIAISTLWVSDMGEQVAGALTQLELEAPLRGVVLDLRGNPGGWRDVLTTVLSHFVRGEVGSFFNRREELPLIVDYGPGPDLVGRPLVVLIDGGTASYAELLAGILQQEAGAWVVGTPSAGNTETIYAYDLNGGARLWVAQEGFRLRDGSNIEGGGVQPDLLIALDWTRYSEASDPSILEAVRLINDQFKDVK
jgi:carboxyl-terminal processing protease